MIISFLQSISKPIFGTFEREEFKKFLRMGLVFTFIIGAYWTLRTLKNSTFCNLVGYSYLPYAKTASLIVLFFLLIFYTKLLDKFNREKVFYVLSTIYAILTVLFALFLQSELIGLGGCKVTQAGDVKSIATMILGFAWYIFVESYGSLIIALFWAIASDTTKPASAKQGFYLVTAIGQIGGILGPKYINKLPRLLGFTTSAISVSVCSIVILLSIIAIKFFFKATPKELLVSYHGVDEKQKEHEQEPGFFEGLKLLVKNNYLLGIFGILAFFEIIVTIFDLHFNALASMTYKGTQLDEYLGLYGSA